MASKWEIGEIVAYVKGLWPHSTVGQDTASLVGIWFDMLGRYDAGDVLAAVKREAETGREFAPPPGVIAHAVGRAQQGAPPSGDDAQLWLARHTRCLPYRPAGQSPEDTVEAIERLMAAGTHEAILRFVASHGVYAIRMMPDPSVEALDPGRDANRRDMLRDYSHRVVPEWEKDPRPGVALERACRSAGIDPATRPQVTAPAPDELRARRERRRLAAPQVEPEPEVADGEMVDFDFEATWAAVKAERARNRELRERAALDARRLRDREDVERREALEELAAHAARRDGTGQDAG